MRFLVDAQLPQRLSRFLEASGHDALHTLELPKGNRTPDVEINRIAERQSRVVITKDSDFVESHLIEGVPPRLLLVATGNISNDRLLRIFEAHLAEIESSLMEHSFVELTPNELFAHE